MSYEPLHHKYRPQTFAELVGQEAIAATLTSALQQQRIAPAYLFTGARGTGKTSSARILAKSLNCLKSKVPTEKPCGICDVCREIARGASLDIIEIDAASNTGVDNIRELIERAQFAPVQCRYKVYIIDEVHMLSTAAFNALLKTLEEPPNRVVFVLATTDPQRVLPTIISRCQRFDYRRIPLDAMVQHLQQIAQREKIAITQDAVTLVAQIAQGGLRDAESLLDQLSLLPGDVSVEQVWDLVGSVPERDLLGLLEAISQDNPEAILDSTRRLMDRGREPLIVLQNLASFYRDLLIAKTVPNRNDLVAVTPPTWQQLCELVQKLDISTILAGQQHLRSAEVQLKHTTQPRLWLEVTLMGLLPSAIAIAPSLPTPTSLANPSPSTPPKPPTSKQPAINPVSPVPATASPPHPSQPSSSPSSAADPPTSHPPKSEKNHSTPEKVHSAIPDPITPAANPANQDNIASQSVPSQSADIGQIWQRVIEQIEPYSTRVMVRQQCQLIAFDGEQARLGVSSQPLFKMGQAKLPNIEAAFQNVFKRKIRISLEVAAPGHSKNSGTSNSPSPPGSPPAPASDPSTPPSSPPSNFSPSNSSVHPPQTQPSPPAAPQSSQSLVSPEVPPPSRPSPTSDQTFSPPGTNPPSPSASEPGNTYVPSWEEDDGIKAARQLADFFGGQVVDDTDGLELPSALKKDREEMEIASTNSTNVPIWADAIPEDDSEDESDVPF
jgi:DNA polymerase-3 subunit gamma/tau